MFRKFLIKKEERALLFRKGDFVGVLHAGEHRFFDPFKQLAVEVFSLAKTAFDHRLADYLRHASGTGGARIPRRAARGNRSRAAL